MIDPAPFDIGDHLGPDEQQWEARFRHLLDDPSVRLVRLVPDRLTATDLSFHPSPEW